MNVAFPVDIAVAPAMLWPWIVEPERMKQWMRGLESVELVSGDGKSAGSRSRMVIKEGGRPASYDVELTEYEPERRLALVIRGARMKGVEIDCRYELVPQAGARTRLDYSCCCRTDRTLWKLMGFLFGWLAKLQAKGFMRTLKRLAEAG